MRAGLALLFAIPVALVLVTLNCVSSVTVRLRTAALPVRMGVGWPWHYYTYPVNNRIEPSEWSTATLLLDVAVALGILAATVCLVWLFTRGREKRGWR
ncbi:MAG: hypothetical protein NTW87_05525 [Planctomycetota bacterium]|nr:hypothetical protein [Planctomycetota bacterium]